MNIGISTIYFSRDIIAKKISWQEIKNKIFELGLNCVELNADIPIDWMSEIKESVEKKEIRVLSLHNFCPSVENIPKGKYGFNVYSLNSPDESERKLALKYTLRTIDYAELLCANRVVLHSGEILTEPSGYELYKIALKFGVDSEVFQRYKNSLIATRNLNKNKYFDLLYSSLDEIVKYAQIKKVKLAIETRFFPDEIPNFEEIGEIIKHYDEKIFYWHDFGHVEIQKRLGFCCGHMEYFRKYKKYLLGYHIHNVKGLEDHFVPNNGEINLEELIEYSEDKVYILEIHSKENFDKLKEAVKFVKFLLKEEIKYERIS